MLEIRDEIFLETTPAALRIGRNGPRAALGPGVPLAGAVNGALQTRRRRISWISAEGIRGPRVVPRRAAAAQARSPARRCPQPSVQPYRKAPANMSPAPTVSTACTVTGATSIHSRPPQTSSPWGPRVMANSRAIVSGQARADSRSETGCSLAASKPEPTTSTPCLPTARPRPRTRSLSDRSAQAAAARRDSRTSSRPHPGPHRRRAPGRD